MDSYLKSFLKMMSRYRYVYVSGPQRSGTRIASKIISYETGFHYVDEDQFGVSKYTDLKKLLFTYTNAVIQCPGLSHVLHTLSTEADCIVFMYRNVQDIIRSQERIKWPCEQMELNHYNASRGPVAQVKYDFWTSVQKPNIHNPFDLNYTDLRSHPFFVEKSKRSGFVWNQTAI